MKKVLVVSDLDGTLLLSNQTISPTTTNIIHQFVESGGYFSYATARSFVTSKKVTNDIQANIPVIVYNGTFIMNHQTGEILVGNYFEKDIQAVILDLIDHDIYPLVYSYQNGHEYFSFIKEKISPGTQSFLKTRLHDLRWKEVNTVDDLLLGDIFYITCIDEKAKLAEMNEKYQTMYHCIYDKDVYSSEQWFEIMPKKASKASAVLQLKEYLKCDRVICFGDGMNDYDLFQVADECYAMANANPDLKKIATAIIESNDQEGVAKFLLKMMNDRLE